MKSRILIRYLAIIFCGIVSIVYLAQVAPAKKRSIDVTGASHSGATPGATPEKSSGTAGDGEAGGSRSSNSRVSAGNASSQYTSPENDSSTDASVTKSWTITEHQAHDKNFLDSLEWIDYPVGEYVLRTGLIYNKWVAATQFVLNGRTVLTEITPPSEYVTIVDPRTGAPAKDVYALDANDDGVLEIAFLHEKLNDKKYHMYTVYALEKDRPKLLWKAGGRLGDWLQSGKPQNSERVRLHLDSDTTK